MCGIFTILNNDIIPFKTIEKSFMKGRPRGPEFSTINTIFKSIFGFHRLAINGLNDTSNQPLIINDITLICNGEIFNYKELYTMMSIEPITESDCEIIIHLYIKYGIEQTLQMLDGEFAFVLLDNRLNSQLYSSIYIARDPYGIRPLYYLKPANKCNLPIYGFASELKCLNDIYNLNPSNHTIQPFTPGTYSTFQLSNLVNSTWTPLHNTPYFIPSFSYSHFIKDNINIPAIYSSVSYYLYNAVIKRCTNSERPIACLLSGGLDSSLITALTNNYYKTIHYPHPLETFSIGLAGSEDLKYARIVADYLGTKHTEIIVTETEMFDIIPEVIYAIESYDTTTVRASIGNYLLGKYIAKNSDAKVILNGDGSDEVCGGYIYMNKCPDNIEFDKEIRRLLKDIHMYDVLRSDKSISSHGLEPRTPFLDRSFVNYYLSIPIHLRNHNNDKTMEKFILRNSFSQQFFTNVDGNQLLPDEILWRRKEAFSDGVSNKGRSLFTILQEYISLHLNLEQNHQLHTFMPSIDTEKYYYKMLFDKFYPNCSQILPYLWMPKYTNATDPSARTLEIYKSDNENTVKTIA
jgi:asparagine synthase (glutamine-hydrolysing)